MRRRLVAGTAWEGCLMDNRQQAVCDRLEGRLLEFLKAYKDWKEPAREIADTVEVTPPEWTSPQAFVESISYALPNLAREAVSRRMGPKDVEKGSPLDHVHNLLP